MGVTRYTPTHAGVSRVGVGGVIGGVGQRMLSGVARKTGTEFFAAVDRDLLGLPAPALAAPGATAAPPVTAQAVPAQAPAPQGVVWTRPVPPVDLGRQRMHDVLLGAAFGALVALLGVLLGAIVAGW